ncbi:hypothetical protein DXC69_03035 [Paenibacillus polymyxa]|nr:hypothetical protein DXC69_03035 [Paenibacillus polymyxa]
MVTVRNQIGNGGANYGTANAALKKKLVQTQSNIANNSGFKQNETQRALSVLQQREAAGQDTSAQRKYLTSNLGYQFPAVTKPSITAQPFKPVNTISANTQQGNELMGQMRQLATKQATPFHMTFNLIQSTRQPCNERRRTSKPVRIRTWPI